MRGASAVVCIPLATGDDVNENAKKGLLDRLKAAASLVGAVAVLFYAVLRLAYVQFYLPLGLRPEEVGFARTELLTQALVGPAVFFIIVFFVAALVLAAVAVYVVAFFVYNDGISRIFARLLDRLPAERRATLRRHPLVKLAGRHPPTEPFVDRLKRLLSKLKRAVVPVIGILALASFGLTSYHLYRNAEEAGRRARAGMAVQGVAFEFSTFDIPLLEVRATPADLYWRGDGRPDDLDDAPLECLMYVGQTTETLVFFTPKNDAVVRLPAGDWIVSLARAQDLPERCRPE